MALTCTQIGYSLLPLAWQLYNAFVYFIQQVNPLLGYNKSKPHTYTTQDALREFILNELQWPQDGIIISQGSLRLGVYSLFHVIIIQQRIQLQLNFFCIFDVHVQENTYTQLAESTNNYNYHDHPLLNLNYIASLKIQKVKKSRKRKTKTKRIISQTD